MVGNGSSGGTLVFVYNADGGLLNGLKDIWHRVTSPSTYPCSLCKLTYGTTGMRSEWRRFVDSLDVPVEFLHRDELAALDLDATDIELPTALLVRDGETEVVVSAPEMRQVNALDDLIALVSRIPALRDQTGRNSS